VKSRLWFLAIPVLALLGLGSFLIPRAQATARLEGTILPSIPAPNFHLRDQSGSLVTLKSLDGRASVVTFMETQCQELCPVVAEEIGRAVSELKQAGITVPVIAFTADPETDNAKSVHLFLHQHELTGWRYLLGSRSRLTPVWASYHVWAAPANAPAALRDSHTAVTFVLDGRHKERVLMTGSLDVHMLVQDLRILSGLPPAAPEQAVAPDPGHVAPNFTLTSLTGARVSLSHLHGKVVLVNFWATWCPACRRELSTVESTFRLLSHRGVEVLGIDKQENASSVAAFARRSGVTYPVAVDSDGSIAGRYFLPYLPDTFLIGPDGRVVAESHGAITVSWVRQHVLPLIAQ
jgi:cytochrome oxidase Cu insertion factor (SCO1/SenC/PrrC family)